MKTRAAVLWGVRQEWKIEEVDLDRPRTGEVLVKWEAAGLCHSDEHLVTGDMLPPEQVGAPSPYPLIGGHEGGGVVVDAGPGVSTLRPGDHVAASFFPSCGRCRYCVTGHTNLCDLGAQTLSLLLVRSVTEPAATTRAARISAPWPSWAPSPSTPLSTRPLP
jgi:S-(hydroxymethyl)glutathione dehydrogenase/alcohol dehydrogenase